MIGNTKLLFYGIKCSIKKQYCNI